MGVPEVVNRWPCVGDPETWHDAGRWVTCDLEGVLSMVALVPGFRIKQSDSAEPVFVVLSSCKFHGKAVRGFLAVRAVDGVDIYGTEYLSENWDTVSGLLDGTEILRAVTA